VTNEKMLQRFKEDRNILLTKKRRKSNRIGHILRRNRLLKHVIEGKIEGNRIRGSKRKQLLEEINERENAGN
jgi:hypothetical protein